MVLLKAKGGKKAKTAVVKPITKAKIAEEVEVPKFKKGKKAKKVVQEPVQEEPEEVGEDSDYEVEEAIGNTNSDEDMKEDESDEVDEDIEDESDELGDEDIDDECEEEEEVKISSKKGKTRVAAAQEEESDSEVDDVEDDDVEDDDDEDVADEDDEEDDDEDVEPVEEEEKEQMETKTNLKRKKTRKNESPAKKPKTEEGDTVTVQFTDLPEGLDDSAFNKFLKSKGVRPAACRANYGKGKAFIDVKKWDKSKVLALDDCAFKGARISVKTDEKDVKTPIAVPDTPRDERDVVSLFCKNLPYDTSEAQIAELFEGVKEVRILKSRDTGKSKGLCFVEFNSKEEKEAAYALKDNIELDGRSIFVDTCGGRPRKAKEEKRSTKNATGNKPGKVLFVKGITEDMTTDDLLKNFEGAVDARIPQDRDTGKNRFFGYIEFESETEATSMYKSSKGGLEVEGAQLIVDYAAERREGGGRGRGRGGFGRGRGRGRGFNRRGGFH